MERTIPVAFMAASLAFCLHSAMASEVKPKPAQTHSRVEKNHRLVWCISRRMHEKDHPSRMKAEKWCVDHLDY
jgi:hypothetical protein